MSVLTCQCCRHGDGGTDFVSLALTGGVMGQSLSLSLFLSSPLPSSVQFSLTRSEKPYALHLVSQKLSPTLPLKRQFQCSSDWRWTLVSRPFPPCLHPFCFCLLYSLRLEQLLFSLLLLLGDLVPGGFCGLLISSWLSQCVGGDGGAIPLTYRAAWFVHLASRLGLKAARVCTGRNDWGRRVGRWRGGGGGVASVHHRPHIQSCVHVGTALRLFLLQFAAYYVTMAFTAVRLSLIDGRKKNYQWWWQLTVQRLA